MKKFLFLVFVLSVSLLFCHFSFSQISTGGDPYSYINPLKNNVHTVTMPVLDMAKIQREDALDEQLGKLPKAGRLHPVSLNLINSGTWTDLDNGDRVWRIKLVSKKALAISLYYDNFYIPNGAIMYIYNEDKSEVIGGFTSINNHSSDLFATELLRGDAIIIEYYEPEAVRGKGIINISDVAHAYRFISPLNGIEKVSDPCEVDVICSEGDNWRDQIRSVARLQIKEGAFFFFCSGAVVNNVRQDCTPYLLTAAHCAENSNDAELNQSIFYFNYERPTCGSGFAPTNQSMTGATRIANDVDCGVTMGSDFLLFELNDTIPTAYNVFYAGWNASTTPSPSGVSIHHPAGDEKKISTYTSALTNTFWCLAPTPSTHWRVFWAGTANGHGVTEPGSSGSPIFDNNGRIVGTLTGGGSLCSQVPNPTPDAYGRVSYHWTSNGTAANQRLKNWLDPDNTGTLILDGTNYPCIPPIADDAGITNIITPIDTICSSSPVVTLRNFGFNTLNNVTINYSVDGSAPNSFSWTGSLASLAAEDVTLTTLTLSTGQHTFDVYTSNPNSQVDGNTGNDSTSSSFTFISANPLTLTFVTADHSLAFLVSWSVKNSSGTVVDSIGGYDRNLTNIERFCIDDGCYTFTVYDPFGSSINDAIYSLINASGDTLVSGSGFAGSDTTYSFCVTMSSINEPASGKSSIIIFPNPTTGNLYVNIHLKKPGNLNIKVYNMLGEIVTQMNTFHRSGDNLRMDLTNQANGIYYVEIRTNSDVIVKKVSLIR